MGWGGCKNDGISSVLVVIVQTGAVIRENFNVLKFAVGGVFGEGQSR